MRLSLQQRRTLAQEYEAGLSSEALAAAHGLSKHAVLDVLHSEEAHVRNQPLTDDKVGECVRLYASGLTIREVGAALGIPKTTVQGALRRQRVAMRHAGGRARHAS